MEGAGAFRATSPRAGAMFPVPRRPFYGSVGRPVGLGWTVMHTAFSPATPQAPLRRTPRLAVLDLARTAALGAMALYHFVYDLELFGHLAPGTAVSGGWRLLAIGTAASFLFLAGTSLWLAHGRGIAWAGVRSRLARVGGAAALISLVTWIAMPQAFIFFGILHAIALCSLVGLLALRAPVAVLLGLAFAALLAPEFARHPVFDTPLLWWTGLQTVPVRSVDYVPLMPWLAPFLLGLAAGRLGTTTGLWKRLAARSMPDWAWRLGWPGRHSLAIYLLHQPILIALVWTATQLLR